MNIGSKFFLCYEKRYIYKYNDREAWEGYNGD